MAMDDVLLENGAGLSHSELFSIQSHHRRQRALPRARGHLGATVRELVERLGRMEGVPLATRVVANGAMGFVVHMVKEMCGFLGNLSFDQHVNTGYVLFKGLK
ncbi:hypothetical protein CFC21_079770 [Triticum aestivum]|uniref:Uncharacterized protein n=3 Tax=Triticinae TaxID=1648030 RepID=A0A9R1L275_WHEAT|nr:hypothetical protein CFC21_079770 [Triticum aestivum]